MKEFRKIRQFKDVVTGIKMSAQYVGQDEDDRPIYDKYAELPVITFKGTEKLHGTNAGVHYHVANDVVTPQKRTAVISINSDNYGFASYVKKHEEFFRSNLREFCAENNIEAVTLFGEWCGGSIQGKVALNQLSKRFVVFSAYNADKGYMDISHWLCYPDKDFYNIHNYAKFECEIDLRYPQLAFPKIEEMTLEVERNSPFAEAMGVPAADGDIKRLGEGIVWVYEDYCFKTKGDRHSKGGGAKKMPSVDPIKAQSVKDFIDKVVTEDRLEQCFEVIKGNADGNEVTTKHIGDLMRWIFNDIMDEEGDALAHNDLCKKDVSGAIANTARPWFLKKINSFD